MTALQFGMGAYKRDFAGAPEIQLLNRFIEQMPTNTIEKVGLLARPGTNMLLTAAPSVPGGLIRKCFSKPGMFQGDLFIVSGGSLYRYSEPTATLQLINGTIGNGQVKMTWVGGEGYKYLFISDGLLLQYYKGGSVASGTLSGTASNQVVDIGGTYFSWNTSVDTNSPAGTAAHPWLCNPEGDYLQALSNAINFVGTPGVDFSTNLLGQNALVTSYTTGGPPATSMTVAAYDDTTNSNSIVTTVTGTGLSWTGATLSGGGNQNLHGVYVPTGEPVNALCTLDGYVMVSIASKNKMYFINPGATVIGALNFFSKESNPDPILDLLTVGDTFLALGSGSIETWYATGNADAPFAPIEGRTEARGVVEGTSVLVQDIPIVVGADGIVYTVQQGLTRISNNGIEERIREQLRSAAGVT